MNYHDNITHVLTLFVIDTFMQNLYIIINPTGRMQSLDLPDSLYDFLDFEDFDILPVKSNDMRVRNLPSAGNTVEMPLEQFENLKTFIKLYQAMHDTIQQYVAISSPNLVNFLLRGILSPEFSHKMPMIFGHFPQLALAYQQTIASVTPSLEQRQSLVLLRPKFVISVLEAYFEQDFVITSAKLSDEKFANASFFDGSIEFKIKVIIDNVLIAVEHGYEFTPITLTVAGEYSMIDNYHFDIENWQVQPDFKRYFDENLFENKQVYLEKIINKSQMIASLENFNQTLVNVAEQFRLAEEKRHEGLPK